MSLLYFYYLAVMNYWYVCIKYLLHECPSDELYVQTFRYLR